mgnify:FL=1
METYTISEFLHKDKYDINVIDKFIGNLKKNKKEYARLVFLLAISIPKPIFAQNNDMGLGDVAYEIIHMVLVFAKYGCLGKGILCMTNEMLAGANLKEASSAGLQYFIFYIVLNIYPRLFSMVKF